MKKYSAFTLVELSLVLIISGLIIYGTMQGIKMLNTSKLAAAQAITAQSPVLDIDGLVAWYETSLPSSFAAGQLNNTAITTWYDNSPKLATNRKNATQATSSYRPKFMTGIFNNAIPAVRFDGSDDALSFDGTILVGTPYTIFVVEQRTRGTAPAFFMKGNNNTAYQIIFLGYASSTSLLFANFGNSNDLYYATIPDYSTPVARIHSYMTDTIYGKRAWLNGGTAYTAPTQTGLLTSFNASTIGDGTYAGDIGEVIMFNRALTNNERQDVETYLSRKFNIKIN